MRPGSKPFATIMHTQNNDHLGHVLADLANLNAARIDHIRQLQKVQLGTNHPVQHSTGFQYQPCFLNEGFIVTVVAVTALK